MTGQALVAVHQVLVVQLGRLLNERIHDVHLSAFRDLIPHESKDTQPLGIGAVHRPNRLATGGQLIDDADIEVSVHGHAECARDGGGRHHEDVRRDLRLGPKPGPLGHAKPVLFVDDHQSEPAEHHLGFQHRMRANQQMNGPIGEAFEDGHPVGLLDRAGEQFHANGQVSEHLPETGEVLLGQDFRRGHDARLTAIVHGQQGGQQGHHGFAAAHIPLQETVHVLAVPRVFPDFADDPLLGPGQLKGNPLGIEAVEGLSHLREGDPWQVLRLGVAVLNQEKLEEEEFFKLQPEAPEPLGIHVLRLVDLFQG